MSTLRYLKPATSNNLPTPDQAGLTAGIHRPLDNGVKANAIGKYAAENGNAATIKRFKIRKKYHATIEEVLRRR